MAGRGLLKLRYLLAEDELLRLKHMAKRIKQFPLQGLVLALQVQHGYRLIFGRRIWRVGFLLHAHILAAAGVPGVNVGTAGPRT